jgi:hypothetical protein
MQSNAKQTGFPQGEILTIVKENVGEMSIDEAIALHQEYQEDRITKVCPCCLEQVYDDQLLLETAEESTYHVPSESYNLCPNCFEPVSAGELEKPEFQLWLQLTA